MRQSWISRIFKSNPTPTVVATPTEVSKPAAPTPAKLVAKVATESAQPSDWRKSWGKIEPWKATPQASSARTSDPPAKHVARTPVPIDPPAQPDPLKDPDWYRGVALKENLPNSKVREETVSPAPSRKENKSLRTKLLSGGRKHPEISGTQGAYAPRSDEIGTTQGANAPRSEALAASSSGQPRGRVIELPANEGNAFWTPPSPPKPPAQQAPKYNAFERDENSPPPQGGAAAMAGAPQGPGQMPMGGPPMGPMPPLMAPRPPMPPPMVNSGVPSGMGNAFTLAGTRRPIPADFGPTPQEPNGFGDAVPYVPGPARPVMPPQSPMLPPSPGTLGTLPLPRPPMPNPMAMLPQPMTVINPLMAVPPTQVASGAAAMPAGPASVPQMLATLKDSLYPSQREWAVEQLSELNGRGQPQVVQSLTKCAKEDPAATVRAACVHALAQMKVNTTEVAAVVQELKNDRDPRVRHEADEALTALGLTTAAHQDSAVQRASHK